MESKNKKWMLLSLLTAGVVTTTSFVVAAIRPGINNIKEDQKSNPDDTNNSGKGKSNPEIQINKEKYLAQVLALTPEEDIRKSPHKKYQDEFSKILDKKTEIENQINNTSDITQLDNLVDKYKTSVEIFKENTNIFWPANGSITKDGENGTIFQAENGDIYAMGNGSGLEVLRNGESDFEKVTTSITTDGKNGTIFQAENGDMYVMGSGTGLEVLYN